MLADDVGYGHVCVKSKIKQDAAHYAIFGRQRSISRTQNKSQVNPCHRERLRVVPADRPLELHRPHANEAGARRVGCDAPGLDQDLKGPDDTVGTHRTLQ